MRGKTSLLSARCHPAPYGAPLAPPGWVDHRRLRATLAQGRRPVNVNDLWIAATAFALGVPVVTQDHDFDVMSELAGLEVVHV